MLQNSILLVDKNFISDSSVSLNLLIQLTEDSFSYAVIEHESNMVRVIYSLQNEEIQSETVEKIFEEHLHLSKNFKAIKSSVRSPNFTFTPDELFTESSRKALEKLFDTTQHLHHAPHKELGIHTTFSTALDLEKILPKQTNILSHLSPSLACIEKDKKDCLLLEFGSNSVSFLCLKDRKLQFQNHFMIDSLEEFNYFLLLVKQQLKLSKNEVILVQGLIDDDDDYFKCIESYFINVKINVIPTQLFGELIEEMPAHYFNSLLSLQQCE